MRIIHFEMEMVAIGTCHVNINLVFDWLIVLVQVIKFHNCAGLAYLDFENFSEFEI